MTTGLIIAAGCSAIFLIAMVLAVFTDIREDLLGLIVFVAFVGIFLGVLADQKEKNKEPIIYVTESGKFISTDSLKIVGQ